MILANKRQPKHWTVWQGGACERPFVGAVVAFRGGDMHPWIAWSCASDDGVTFDCFWGHYCDTFEEAHEAYVRKCNASVGYLQATCHCDVGYLCSLHHIETDDEYVDRVAKIEGR